MWCTHLAGKDGAVPLFVHLGAKACHVDWDASVVGKHLIAHIDVNRVPPRLNSTARWTAVLESIRPGGVANHGHRA